MKEYGYVDKCDRAFNAAYGGFIDELMRVGK